MRAQTHSGWLRRVGPWVGIGTSPAAIMMGGGLAEGLEGLLLVATLTVGVVALTALAVAQGVLGQRRRMPLGPLTAGPLGEAGARRVAALAMLMMMVGWYGVNVGVAGVATGRLLGIPDTGGIVLFGLLALATVWRGISALSWAALAAGVATVVLAAWGLHLAAGSSDLALTSARTAADPVSPLQGIAIVVGFGAAFALRTPDFTRDLERPRQVLWCALAGMTVPLVCFALAGAALHAATGTWDLADVLNRLSSPTAAYLFVAIGFFGSVMTNVYSGALALEAAGRVRHRHAMVAVTLVGMVLAASGFRERMLGYLVGMAILAPGLVVLCVLFWRGPARVTPGWRRPGLVAWGVSVGVGLGVQATGSGAGALAAALVAGFAGLRSADVVRETPESSHPKRRTYGDRRW